MDIATKQFLITVARSSAYQDIVSRLQEAHAKCTPIPYTNIDTLFGYITLRDDNGRSLATISNETPNLEDVITPEIAPLFVTKPNTNHSDFDEAINSAQRLLIDSFDQNLTYTKAAEMAYQLIEGTLRTIKHDVVKKEAPTPRFNMI